MYLYLWKTKISSGSIETREDLLESISYAVRHGQEFPEIIEQKIVDENSKEVCVFRDTRLNGK